jgi:glutamate racemase
MHNQRPIGIFDSGVGGLTVARAITERLPGERLIYVGDTRHMPYGDKSAEHIIEYCERIVEFLIREDVKLIVIACNTASAMAASHLRAKYWPQVEIRGVGRPAVEAVIRAGYKRLGIIGTKGTIQSNIYGQLFSEYPHPPALVQLPTPLLAPMIEQGLYGTRVSRAVLDEYLSFEGFRDTDAMLLACTHYPLIRDEVDAWFGHTKAILDNAGPMSAHVQEWLSSHQLLSEAPSGPSSFYVTEYSSSFAETARLFFGAEVPIAEIDLHSA